MNREDREQALFDLIRNAMIWEGVEDWEAEAEAKPKKPKPTIGNPFPKTPEPKPKPMKFRMIFQARDLDKLERALDHIKNLIRVEDVQYVKQEDDHLRWVSINSENNS